MKNDKNLKQPFLWHFIKSVPKTLSASDGQEQPHPLTASITEENKQAFIELYV